MWPCLTDVLLALNGYMSGRIPCSPLCVKEDNFLGHPTRENKTFLFKKKNVFKGGSSFTPVRRRETGARERALMR